MSIQQTAEPAIPGRTVVAELRLYHLNLMRVGYAVMGIGLAAVKWPLFATHREPWPLFEGVVTCILAAMSLLAFLGLRIRYGCCRSFCWSAPGRPSGCWSSLRRSSSLAP
jgi:hypothetical protein